MGAREGGGGRGGRVMHDQYGSTEHTKEANKIVQRGGGGGGGGAIKIMNRAENQNIHRSDYQNRSPE